MKSGTTAATQKPNVIENLSNGGHACVMIEPMLPCLNEHEMQRIMKEAAHQDKTFTFDTFI